MALELRELPHPLFESILVFAVPVRFNVLIRFTLATTLLLLLDAHHFSGVSGCINRHNSRKTWSCGQCPYWRALLTRITNPWRIETRLVRS